MEEIMDEKLILRNRLKETRAEKSCPKVSFPKW